MFLFVVCDCDPAKRRFIDDSVVKMSITFIRNFLREVRRSAAFKDMPLRDLRAAFQEYVDIDRR